MRRTVGVPYACKIGGNLMEISDLLDNSKGEYQMGDNLYPEKEMYNMRGPVRIYAEYKPILKNCDIEEGALVSGQVVLEDVIVEKGAIVRGDDVVKKEGHGVAIEGKYAHIKNTGMVHYHCKFNGTKEKPIIIAGLAHGAVYKEGAELYGTEFKAKKVGKGAVVCGIIVGVEIPDGRFVPYGVAVTTQEQANELPKLSDIKPEEVERHKALAITGQLKRREMRSINAKPMREMIDIIKGTFIEPSVVAEGLSKGERTQITVGEKTHISVDVYTNADRVEIGRGVNEQDGVTAKAKELTVGDMVSLPHLVYREATESIEIGKQFDDEKYEQLQSELERVMSGEITHINQLSEIINFAGVGEIKNAKLIKEGQGVVCGAGYSIDGEGKEVIIPDYFFMPHGFMGGQKELKEEILRQKETLGLKPEESFAKDNNCIPPELALFAWTVCGDNIRMANDNLKLESKITRLN